MIETRTDILIAGAGAAGLSAAIALAQRGRKVVVAGRIETARAGRTIALLGASMRFYEAIGLAGAIGARGASLQIMRIVDDTGSLFRLPQADFKAAEIGLETFGINIENADLSGLLLDAARATPGVTIRETLLDDFVFGPDEVLARTADGERIIASLLVAADGRSSSVRTAAGIDVQERRYPQTALTAIFAHDRPHRNVSTEFHTRAGPFTLVPLPPTDNEPHRSSLVWMMPPDEAEATAALPAADLGFLVERRAHSMLGKMRLRGACGLVPMGTLRAERFAGERVALIGDAAHAVPPIGAQGLNLGLRDIGFLVEATEGRGDPGDAAALSAYQASRAADIRIRTGGVDLLNRSLLTNMLPVDFLRGAGLLALTSIGPLRRMVMREGVEPFGRTPRMMRSAPQRAKRL